MAHRYEHTRYNQGDGRWGKKLYSPNMTYEVGGCGPTAVADAVSGINGNGIVLPTDVGDFIRSIGGVSDGQGTNWDAIPLACQRFGIKCTQLFSHSEYGIKGMTTCRQELANKLPDERYVAIGLHGRGYFSGEGHFNFWRDARLLPTLAVEVFDVAYPPRDGWHEWYGIPSANAPGIAVVNGLPYIDQTLKGGYIIDLGATVNTSDTEIVFIHMNKTLFGSKYSPFVVIWQCILRARGYKYKDNLLEVTGFFNGATKECTKKFQADNNIKITGGVARKNWATALGITTGQNVGEDQYKVRMKQVGFDGKEKSVYALFVQEILTAFGLYDGGLDWIPGGGTTKGIGRLQEILGLNHDNIFGPKCYNALTHLTQAQLNKLKGK